MASFFGHFIAGATIASAFFPGKTPVKIAVAAGICACLPDADFITFKLGISYHSIWGHRGASHSALVTLLTGLAVAWLFFRHHPQIARIYPVLALATFSHPILDAMTNGGLGVALYFPVSYERIFLPFRPLQVSPLQLSDFWGEWAQKVLWTEFVWVALPCLAIWLVIKILYKNTTSAGG